MRFDLFYELAVPRFAGRAESQVFHDALAELELADALGFDTAWLVEHHFMPEYSHSSAPDLTLAAAAARTRRLRLGHAIVPLPYHHALHVAERVATLDVLSRGRVEFGFGRGFSPREYRAFGVDMGDSRARVADAFALIKQSLTDGSVTLAGETLHVLPRPVQTPHPPLWTAAVSPESFELAAQWGVGVLVGPFKPWFMAKEDIARYRAAFRARHGDGGPGLNRRVAYTVGVVCLEDGERARALAQESLVWFYRKLLAQTAPVLQTLHDGYEYYRRWGLLKPLLERGLNLTILETLGMAVAGDPDHCARKLETFAAAGVDHLLCGVGAGALPSDTVKECLRTLAAHVMPRFAGAACASS